MGLHAGILDWSYGGGNCGSDVGGGWDEVNRKPSSFPSKLITFAKGI